MLLQLLIAVLVAHLLASSSTPGRISSLGDDEAMTPGEAASESIHGTVIKAGSQGGSNSGDPMSYQPSALSSALESEYVDQFGEFRESVHLELWNTQFEFVPGQLFGTGGSFLPPERLTLGRVIGHRRGSLSVYELKHHKQWVIKYEAFCGDEYFEPFEAIPNEAKFLKILLNAGVANQYLYHSRAVEPIDDIYYQPTGKIDYLVPCHPTLQMFTEPRIRFLITERVNHILSNRMHRYASRRLSFEDAVRIGIQLLRALGILQLHNVVHGDIHEGNIGWRALGADQEIVLIDFGRARMEADGQEYAVLSKSDSWGPNNVHCDGLLSPWTSVGLTPNFRDDVYRAFQVMAAAMYGPTHAEAQTNMCKEKLLYRYSMYMHLKLEANIFDVSIGGSEFRLEDILRGTRFASRVVLISAILSDSLDIIRKSTGKPNIEKLIRRLNSILKYI